MLKKLEQLTLEEKIGQLIVFGFHEDHYASNIENLIKNHKLGNILLFSRNVSSSEKLFILNKNIQKAMLKYLQIPAFITADQEGGMVTRLFGDATIFPGAMAISAANNPHNAYLSGLYMADEMDALGINVNFAPVLDVNNNPLNPVIGVRSYSDRPEVVSEYANQYISGLQSKVIATAKHFPGHGDTHVDSHLDLPHVDFGKQRLHEMELYPFKKAIKNNLKAVMGAHIVYQDITNGMPATLSKEALTDLLRGELGFTGLVFTDGMEMKAILNRYGAVESAVPAILAGANLLLYCHHEDQQIAAAKVIKEAVLDGTLPLEVLNERVARILKYKAELNLDIVKQDYQDVKPRVGNKIHREFAQNILNQALTLVKGKPFKAQGKTLFISQSPQATTFADLTDGKSNTIEILKDVLPQFDYYQAQINPTADEINKLKDMALKYDQIVLTSYNSNVFKNQIKLLKELVQTKKELHVISLRNPYDHYLVPEIENYVCLYEYTANSVNTLKDYLLGKIKPKGKLPINV
ncbi:MAG: beta-N-acetylhexosaminidase [Acholeplasmataceae bacterium]|jgi:beta-N-acetylhexosaminidase|nr:beta-N-acetylhexosaminidase [Acholeplasmataceae bacterium]